MENKRNPAELFGSIMKDIKELIRAFGCDDLEGGRVGTEVTPCLSDYTNVYWRVGQMNQTIYTASAPADTFSLSRSSEFEYTHLYSAEGFTLIRTDPNWTDRVEYRIFSDARRVLGRETITHVQGEENHGSNH
jgi:hypothetical protein